MLQCRPETPEDAEAIRQVLQGSFPTPSEARLVEILREADQFIASIVAERDGEVVGHVAFSPVTVGKVVGAGLAPVAVGQEHRKRGIAARMIREGLSTCKRQGFGFVVVLGDPKYYGRFGFRPASQWRLVDEYDGGDYFQALELTPGSIPQDGGLVKYGAAFAMFSDDASHGQGVSEEPGT